MRAPGTLHLLIGPVGAGKTTYAQQRIARSPAIHLDVDACMMRLFRDDPRPAEGVMAWYLERRERCRGLLWDVAVSALLCGADVFIEFGLLQQVEREAFYERTRADVETCPRCGGRMRLLALITEPQSVARFLRHRGDPTAPPARAPPRDPSYFKTLVVRRRPASESSHQGELFEEH